MGVHLYCIMPAGRTPPPGLTGIADEPVAVEAAGRLACWLSVHAGRPAPTRTALQQHAAVAAAAMDESVTPVPVRFGQWLADPGAAAARMLEDEARWCEILDAVAGHAEFGVRIALPEDVDAARDVHAAAATTGKDYMTALARREARVARRRRLADELAAWIAAAVGSLAARTHVESGRGTVGIAHLVAWRDVDAYRSLLDDLRAARGDLRIATSGPWPPFSFVN